MAELIFKKLTCKKGELYDNIINLMKSVGWEDISSSPDTDYNVMHSTGENNNTDIYIQLRPNNGTVTNNVSTSNKSMLGMRLLKTYVPSDDGTSGTFTRESELWLDLMLIGGMSEGSVSPTLDGFEITYYVDKYFCFFIIRPPASVKSTYGNTYFAFGVPIDGYSDQVGHRETFAISSGSSTSSPFYGGAVYIDSPTGVADLSKATKFTTYVYSPPAKSDYKGRPALCQVYFGSNAIGIRQILQGIYAIQVPTFTDLDIIIDDATGHKYEFLNGYVSNDSMPSSTYGMVYRIEDEV